MADEKNWDDDREPGDTVVPEVVDIDLTNPVDGNWRDNLRANPRDSRYFGPSVEIYLTPVDKPSPKK
jgi:hypothetical protein